LESLLQLRIHHQNFLILLLHRQFLIRQVPDWKKIFAVVPPEKLSYWNWMIVTVMAKKFVAMVRVQVLRGKTSQYWMMNCWMTSFGSH
jgi:hypothetical protein